MNQAREPDAGGARELEQLTDAELRAIEYFAVGVTSEGNKDAYRMVVAGDIRSTPIVTPADNSGYTIGTLQTDMGQHPEVVPELVAAYQTWARTQRPDLSLTEQEVRDTTAGLSRNGRTIANRDHGQDIDADIRTNIDRFLGTDDGKRFVHSRDIVQADRLTTEVMTPLGETALYRGSTVEDQARIATMVAKTFNQNEVAGRAVLDGIADGSHDSVEDVRQAISDRFPRRHGDADYLESGRDHALHGTEVFLALRASNEQNPLNTAWRSVLADPLVNPVDLRHDAAANPAPLPPRMPDRGAAPAGAPEPLQPWQPPWAGAQNPNLGAEYETIKSLYLQPDQGLQTIRALDEGRTYSWGRPQPENGRGATAGFYVAGNDFVTWNHEGHGHAFIGGEWSEVNRDNLFRSRNNDGTVDLNLTRNGEVTRLLHIDPQAPALRANDPARENVPAAAPRMGVPGGRGEPDDRGRPEHPDQPNRPAHGGQAHALPIGSHDQALFDRLFQTARGQERWDDDQGRNIAAAGPVATKENATVRRADDVGIYNGQLFVSYFPHGKGVEPMFNARVDLDQAAQVPAQQSLQRAEQLDQARSQAQAQQVALNPAQDEPSGPKIGPRTV